MKKAGNTFTTMTGCVIHWLMNAIFKEYLGFATAQENLK